jgi:hypothetical protein
MEQQAQPLQPEQPRRKKVFFTGGLLIRSNQAAK